MPMDTKQLWGGVLGEIEPTISRANFSTWFKNTHIAKYEEGIIVVGVPNEFVKDWLFNKYHKPILKSLRELAGGVRGLEYVVSNKTPAETAMPAVHIFQQSMNNELPLNDLYVDKKDNLNPRYTFETLVVGPFNELAHAAARAVIKNPGIVYNPFFVHGGTGLGKTHLIQAIGNHIKTVMPGKKISYVTSEKFLVDYITSLQNNKVNDFKDKYRKFDVFIVDDIQFLSNKEKSQEEFFHLYNTLYENNKQIVLSSDVHPNFIPGLEERLKSRFGAGMIVDISQPEYESRFAILRHKANSKGFFPPEEILEYLASSLQVNIRELEGILNTLICQAQMKQKGLSLEDVKSLIKNSVRPKKNASIKDVVKAVAAFYNIEEETIYEKTRKKEIVKPRQVVMYLLREDFGVSYPTIGQKLGGRDHTTVMHSCDKVRKDIKNDNFLVQELEQLRALL